MPILNSIVNWVNIKRIYQIDLFKKYPLEVQREALLNMIKKSRDTEWGIKYDFQSIRSIEQFKERIPLQTYEEIKPYIDRSRMGESNLLWPGEIKWFAKSSGTTNNKSKFIPVSKDALESCHFRGLRDVLALYNRNYPGNKVLMGKTLTLGGSHTVNNIHNNSYYGDLSAILIENVPFWTEFRRTPSTEIALIHEFEEKVEKIISNSINENVTAIAGVPSWYLVLLRRVLEVTGKKNIHEVWPNLEVFIHGGVRFDPYREQYNTLFPSPDMHYMEAYNASEGFFGIQDEPQRDDMLLMLDYGIYYEFIPMDQFGSNDPDVLSIDEVETGKNYALVISTNGGLWRYLIGDTVTFTSTSPFRIKITGRTKHFINAFGEELIIDNAENALKIATERTGAIISEYSAGPIFMSTKQKGAHQWIIEFEKMPDDLERFTSILDDALKTLNSDYEAKRHKDTTLEIPKVVIAPQGTFYTWMKQRNKLGGQNKIPRLANDRQYLDTLLEIITSQQ
ncbi:MAG: GH3 auxin-responsive promoter family protein [Bacteroidota bacterium]|nr:GH3 auxin-responsive promoter family protein [Bacteroidota bacterium]MDP4206529.1 GH3 auxin-responsive promoter family protein [Bacteroidota bacterium]